MARVHFYNPGYEASLLLSSEKGRGFTPAKNVRLLRQDLATLPVYWAEEGERILVPESQLRDFPLPSFVTCPAKDDVIEPWGWAPELARFGAVSHSDEEMRFWGNRLRSPELFERILLLDEGRHFSPEVIHPLVVRPGAPFPTYPQVRKGLFGSSGRGVSFFPKGSTPRDVNGGRMPVIAEPYYEKVEDLGFEFYLSGDGTVRFLGTSLFETETGRYAGNRLNAPHKAELEAYFGWYIALLTEALRGFDLRGYSGLIGIDTLTYRSDGRLCIVPLIEVNIRRTMGHLALKLEELFPEASRFEILFGDCGVFSGKEPLYFGQKALGDSLSPGRYPLTPVTPDTRFCALLTV